MEYLQHATLAKRKMVLALQAPQSLTSLLPPPFQSPKIRTLRSGTKIAIRAQSSEEASVTAAEGEAAATANSSKGVGFGSSPAASKGGKKKKGRERASVVRRPPIVKPALLNSTVDSEGEKQGTNKEAFLLTWLGLGLLILVEGILLAASGFLPEGWDSFFVKYFYPSFTPTVLLFVGGTVAYGVFKYIQK